MRSEWLAAGVAALAVCGGAPSEPRSVDGSPYPASDVVASASWDFDAIATAAPGSDLWPTTWAQDGHLYATWGDGGGFGGTNREGRVSLGVARIEGGGADWRGFNVFGGKGAEAPATFEGKAHPLAVDDRLYLFVSEQDGWRRSKIGVSTDAGRSWRFSGGSFAAAPWDFAEPGGAFGAPVPLQLGRGHAGARDDYVHLYSEKTRGDGFNRDLLLARVHRDRILDRPAYSFWAGHGSGGARWTRDVRGAAPVFSDPRGVNWGYRAAYHPILRRYLLSVRRPDAAGGREGAWGLFDAPEPWGPWTTIAYYRDWDAGTPIDGVARQIGYGFPTKWMTDARTLWMVVSMTDSFNVIRGTLHLRGGRDAGPRPRQGLRTMEDLLVGQQTESPTGPRAQLLRIGAGLDAKTRPPEPVDVVAGVESHVVELAEEAFPILWGDQRRVFLGRLERQ